MRFAFFTATIFFSFFIIDAISDKKRRKKSQPKVEVPKQPKVENIKKQKSEIKNQPKVEVKKEPKVEIKQEPKVEIKKDIKQEPKAEIKKDIKQEPKQDDKNDIKGEEKQNIKMDKKWEKAKVNTPKGKRATLNEKMKVQKPFPEELKIIPTSQTCMEIAMAVTAKDEENFEKLTTRAMELNEELGEEEARNLVLSFYLVNCISTIDPIEISMIRSQKQSKMEVDYEDFKNTLKYEEVRDILIKNNSKKIDEYNTRVELYNAQYKEAMQKLQDQRKGDPFKRRGGDVGIFGNKLKEIPKTRKNLIGFGLLAVIIIALGIMSYKLLKPKTKEKKKKKDKKSQ